MPEQRHRSGSTREASLARRLSLWSVLLVWLALGCQALFGSVTVTRGSDSDANCTVGEYRCNGEYLLACDSAATGWSQKATCGSGALCDAKAKHCTVCKDGDFRCSGADRQQCATDGMSWKTIQPCPAENLCSESSCEGCVTDGQLDCSVAPLLRKCQAGTWVTLDTCGSQALCEATTAYAGTSTDWNQKCVAAGCEQPGTYRCQGSVLQRCPPERDAWTTVDTCANPELCDAAAIRVNSNADPNAAATLDMCKPACPTPGAFVCDGLTLTQCRTNQTAFDYVKTCAMDTECDPAAGDCGQLCTPGRFQCNGATLRKCGSDGHWVNSAKCETAALCSVSNDGVTGVCVASPCGTADFTCSGAQLQKCRDDRTGYGDYRTCVSAPLCDAPSARCIEPTCPQPNAYQCFGQELKQCSADQTQWVSKKTCAASEYCDASAATPGCSTECPANPVRCNGKVMERCTKDKGWTTQATCATPDLCSCALTDPDGTGPLTNTCALGLFTDGCGNALCGGSKAQFQCQGRQLQQCQAGRNGWDNTTLCGAANLCYPGEGPTYTNGYCLTCPTAGELSCNGSTTTLQVCSADRRTWVTPTNCALGCITATNANDYCAVCQAGTAQCSGATLQICPADQKQWNSKTCNSAALCDRQNQQCDVCKQTTCTGQVLNKCSSDGQILQSQTCGTFCDAANQRCNSCNPSSVWCDLDTAKLNTCSADGQTITSVQCATAGLCESKNNGDENICHPPACAVGQRRCDPTNLAVLQICNAQRTGWDLVATCASAALCDSTKTACVAPTCMPAGQKRCNLAQPETCKADLTGWASNGSACASSALCDKTTFACNPKACSAGDKKCMGAQPVICNADLTDFTPNGAVCPVGCNNGACVACLVGDHKCNAAGTNSQVCNASQTGFIDDVPCGTAGCNTSTNACNPALICTPNMFRCSPTSPLTLQQCNPAGTAWSTETVCTTICDATGGECDECVAPQFDCENNLKCTASGHFSGTACDLNDDQLQPRGHLRRPPQWWRWRFRSRRWRFRSRVGGSGPDVGGSESGRRRHRGRSGRTMKSEGTAAHRSRQSASKALCLGLVWLLTACQVAFGDFEFDLSKLAVTCESGVARCKDGKIQTCVKGKEWQLVANCGSSDLCNLNERKCEPCRPGQYQCNDAQPERCGSDLKWTAPIAQPCASAALCKLADDSASASCLPPGCPAPGALQCSGDRLQQCPESLVAWADVELCASAVLCDVNAANAQVAAHGFPTCVVPTCSPGQFNCDSGSPRPCNADRNGWGPALATCNGACNVAKGDCSPCTDGTYTCSGRELSQCTAQTWSSVACSSVLSCNSAARSARM